MKHISMDRQAGVLGAKQQASRPGLLWRAAALAAASLAGPAQAGEAAPAAPQFQSFATPDLEDNSVRFVCHIGNIGTKMVNVRGFGLRNRTGALGATSNSCLGVASFSLTPGQSCTISASSALEANCVAAADDVSVLRGSLESRYSNGAVRSTMRMTPGIAGSAILASPPMFGGSTQAEAHCNFLNVGAFPVAFSNVRLVTPPIRRFRPMQFVSQPTVRTSDTGTIPPGGLCHHYNSSIPVSDIQCLARVTLARMSEGASL